MSLNFSLFHRLLIENYSCKYMGFFLIIYKKNNELLDLFEKMLV